MAASGQAIVLGALLAGFAVGFRSQTLWITAPLLVLVLADRVGRGVAGAMLGSSIAFAAGALAWGVPLLVASGGLQAYLAALGSQAGEDFAGVEMLYLNPTPRLAAFALLRTFVWPWDSVPLASVVLVFAALGALLLVVRERRTLAAVAAFTLPYLVFHLAFQDTTFARYALPTVFAVAFLAAVALDAAGRAGAVAARGAGRVESQRRRAAAGGLRRTWQPDRPALRPCHRGRRRGRAAAGGRDAPGVAASARGRDPRPIGARLPSPPRREWLELARHWQSGAARPGLVPGRSATHRPGARRSAGPARRRDLHLGRRRACRCSAACGPPTCSGIASASPGGSPPKAGASRRKPPAWPA